MIRAFLIALLTSVLALGPGAWAAVSARNGVTVSTSSTINGRSSLSHVNGQALATGGGGPSLILADNSAPGAQSGTDTSSLNTTGANFLAVLVSYYVGGSGFSFNDNKSNSFTSLTLRSSTDIHTRLYYVYGPTVGTGHVFSASGTNTYPSILVYAFSGVASSPFDAEAGAVNNSSHTSLATGSVSPVQANTLWITGGSFGGTSGGGSVSADSGFSSALIATDIPAQRIPGFLAYKVVSSSSSVNVTWSVGDTASQGAVFLAAFKY